MVRLRDDRRIRRTKKGEFELRLPDAERDILRGLPDELREVFGGDDAVLERLFPAAYPDDEAHEKEFQGMVRDDLFEQRRTALATMEGTIDAERVSEDELLAWLSSINDARLVLGLRLDVTEELDIAGIAPDDPRAPSFALYGFLTFLEGEAIEALSAAL